MKLLKRKRLVQAFFPIPNLAGAYLFGSQAAKLTHQGSDVDVGLVFTRKQNLKNLLTLHGLCYRALAPFFENRTKKREVDIVFLQTAPITLQREAVNTGKLIFIKDPKTLIDFEEQVLRNYADYYPYLERAKNENLEKMVSFSAL